MAEYPTWAVVSAIRQGLSANAGLAAYREAGGAIRRETWLRLYSEIKANQIAQAVEISAIQSRAPLRSEAVPFPTKTAEGYMQQVDVYVRDRVTGTVEARPFLLRGDSLMTRADAIETALDRYARAIEENPEEYDEQILGGLHIAAYELYIDPTL